MNFLSFNSGSPLLFTVLEFWLFLLVVLIVFGIIKKQLKAQHLWLLLCSYFFYYKSSGNFVVLLLAVTLLTFFFAKAISKCHNKSRRKTLLTLGIIFDVSFLIYFKYTYFFIDLINNVWDTSIVAQDYLSLFVNNTFGTHFSVSKIILPVGISFFSFQAISYLVDVYKNRIDSNTSFWDFAFYISFFPQLVAGPIVRADSFLPQLKKPYSLSKEDFNLAFFFILNGLLKKVCISDYISINFVDRVFSSPDTFTGVENLLATYGYTIQIYCDFSGYTDIAIAISLLFGFHLPLNFNSPYKAVNITDFWRRWHISLSSWLKDYIYIPLGGNRKGKVRQYLNLLTTMLIGGLWHGANLKFIFWGAAHGLLLCIDKIWSKIIGTLQNNKIYRVFSIFITFHLVACLWIFFRADSFNIAITILQKIFASDFSMLPTIFAAYYKPLSIIAFALVIHLLPENCKKTYRKFFCNKSLVFKCLIAILVVFLMVQMKSAAIQPFIYFQF